MRRLILVLAVVLSFSFLAQTLHLPQVEAQENNNTVIINTTSLNIRTGPDAKYASVGVLRGGESYLATGISPDKIWFYIVGTAYGDGWVRGRFTIFRGDIHSLPVIAGGYGALESSTFVVNINTVVYEQPNGKQLGTIPFGGQEYAATGRVYDGGWVRIETPDYGSVWVRWASGAFRGVYFNLPIIYGHAPMEEAVELPYLVVNTTGLHLRTGPSVAYAAIAELRGGESYPILGASEDRIWFYITGTPYGDGWVRGGFTIFRGNINAVPSLDGPNGALAPSRFFVHIYIPVYDDIRGSQVGLLAGRTEYMVTGRSLDGIWVQLQTQQFGSVWTQNSRGSFRGYWPNVPVIQ